MDRTDELALVKDINENLCFVKNNFEQANRCAGQMRSALNSAVKLFWLKKYDKIPVWVENNVETFSLYRATEDERFFKYFNKIVMSDIHTLRQMCNDALHDADFFVLADAKELLSRLEKCIKAIEKEIHMTILTQSVADKSSQVKEHPVIVTARQNNSSSFKNNTIRSRKIMKTDPELTIIISNQKVTRERKTGYLTRDTHGNNIGLVFMSDDKRAARFGSAEIMFFREYEEKYGKWRVINIGRRLPFNELEKILREHGSHTLTTKSRTRKV